MKPNNPKHIAIILDGNRRFAKRLMLQPWKGHEFGAKKVEDLIDHAKEYGVDELTFYALSCENINTRPKNELFFLYNLMRKEFKNLNWEKIKKNKVKMRFIGQLNLLPIDLRKLCKEIEQQTKNNNNFIVNFAIAYGGRQEIIEAVKKIIKNKIPPEDINENIIEKNLYLDSDPDLIIRTGGEKRTSNFLPWQSTYSELIFSEKMWPEFSLQDFSSCLDEFKSRKRRFGG